MTQNIIKSRKKRIAFFYRSIKGLKWRNQRWPPKYIKLNIFTNNFATTYARDINNMSILMFSGMRKPILSLVFSLFLCKYEQKQADIAVKLQLTLFWLIVFFLF